MTDFYSPLNYTTLIIITFIDIIVIPLVHILQYYLATFITCFLVFHVTNSLAWVLDFFLSELCILNQYIFSLIVNIYFVYILSSYISASSSVQENNINVIRGKKGWSERLPILCCLGVTLCTWSLFKQPLFSDTKIQFNSAYLI